MLYRLHNNIFIIGVLTFGLLALLSKGRAFSAITPFTIFAFVTQIAMIIWFSRNERIYYSEKTLFILVLIYSILLGGLIISMSYFFYGGEKFLFEDPDALFYYKEGLKTKYLGFIENANRMLSTYEFDDCGALLFNNFMLSIIPSSFFVNFVHLVIGAITAVLLFRIGRYIMPDKYAFLSALAYSTSSYIMMFHCTLLKESLFVFFVTCTMYFFYKSIADGNHVALLGVFVFLTINISFRPAVVLFLAVAFFAYYAIAKRGSAISIFLYGIIAVSLVASLAFMQSQVDHYTEGGDSEMLLAENGSGNYSGGFNFFVGWFSALFGPFPTLFPAVSSGLRNINFYGAGLTYKLFLVVPLWTGIYYVIKRFDILMVPIVIFVLTEMAATGFIMASFELRKVLLHIPFTYIVVFYGLYHFEKSKVNQSYKCLFEFVGSVLAIGILLLWNVIKVKG